MENVGGGRYEGEVWRPSDNRIYSGYIELSGNSLNLVGCALGCLFKGEQTWTRVQ